MAARHGVFWGTAMGSEPRRVVGHKLGGNGLDLPRPCGREEERLALARQCGHDALDLGLKAHVQHAVGFIQHQVGDLSQPDLAAFQEVIQAPWRGNDEVDAVLNVPQLRALGRSAVRAPAQDDRFA